jgi:hypothetical protein
MVPPEPPNEPGADLAVMDEILQVMYWLRGERLAAEVVPLDLTRWLGRPGHEIEPLLGRLVGAGLVQRVAGAPGATPRYALTAAGLREGGRRFADEFAGLTRPGHGECGDPNCECQRSGNPADCEHRHA